MALEGLCVWSVGALFSARIPSSKRSFSTRVEVKLRGESWEKEGETFCPGIPGRRNWSKGGNNVQECAERCTATPGTDAKRTPCKARPLRQHGTLFRGQHGSLPSSLSHQTATLPLAPRSEPPGDSGPCGTVHQGERATVPGTRWPVSWRRGRRAEETLSSNNPPSLGAPHVLTRTGMPTSG